MSYTYLYSDLLFYLVILGILSIFYLRRKDPYWRMAWLEIASTRTGCVASVVVASFFWVAICDSVHFRTVTIEHNVHISQEESLLDKFVAPLGRMEEKTYVAPWQNRLFVAQNLELSKDRYELISHHPITLSAQSKLLAMHVVMALVIGGLVFWILRFLGDRLTQRSAQYGSVRWNTLAMTCSVVIVLFYIIKVFSAYTYLLGTNKIGQDVLYQCLKGTRTAVLLASITSLLTLPFALFLGGIAGYFGGLIDDLIQFVYTVLSSIPGILLIAASLLSLQLFLARHPNWFVTHDQYVDLRFLGLCFIIGLSSWTDLCRLVRAETMKFRELDFVAAARAFNQSRLHIFCKHIVPNLTPLLLICLVMDFSGLVLAEAVLSYVGIGVDPSMYSWGNMINSARLELARSPIIWWPVVSAFGFMLVLVLAINLFAEQLRQAFDPRGRRNVRTLA